MLNQKLIKSIVEWKLNPIGPQHVIILLFFLELATIYGPPPNLLELKGAELIKL